MFSTYEAAEQFLYESLPMFQRIGAAALKPDLQNTIRLCRVLGDPQNKFKSIHVAGTNGKGSSSHMLASVFQEAGYRTGLYTSPHLKHFTERIRVNGVEISRAAVVDFVNRITPAIHEIEPSFFEITVAMAFDYFVAQEVDIAIIETGLGGRLDSTNVITPELSLITNIGWDHKELLGNTLEKIALEKAGIIKSHVPVVISERQPGLDSIFIRKSEEMQAPIMFASDNYSATHYADSDGIWVDIQKQGVNILSSFRSPLQGIYQKKNIAGVIQSLDVIRGMGWKITLPDILNGLQNVISRTGLKGRWQILGERPLKVCDTGHNVDGIREVVSQIKMQKFEKLYVVLGAVNDKDISSIIGMLPTDAIYFYCQAKIPRALDATLLAEECGKLGLRGTVVPDVNDAIAAADRVATENDMIFIGGSTFVVAEIDNL